MIERAFVIQLEAGQLHITRRVVEIFLPLLPFLKAQALQEIIERRARVRKKQIKAGAAGAVGQADGLKFVTSEIQVIARLRHHLTHLLIVSLDFGSLKFSVEISAP